MLVRRLGDEGRDILESDIGMDRLTVPRNEALFKREGKHSFCGGGELLFYCMLDELTALCLSDN
jgi:hypothetical protein